MLFRKNMGVTPRIDSGRKLWRWFTLLCLSRLHDDALVLVCLASRC